MLRYQQDLRSLSFIAVSVFLLIWGLWSPVGLESFIIVPLASLAFYICFTINHNQLHLGIFSSNILNTLTNVVLSLCTGVPVTLIYLPHVKNHHPNPCTLDDWSGAHLAEGHQGIFRALVYIFRAQTAVMKCRPRSLFAGLSHYRKISLCLEILALGLYCAYAVLNHPGGFFIHNLVPWLLSMNVLVLMNFALHDGCDYNSRMDHSLTFTTKIGNYLLLNNGYHLAHHENPKLHWSKLKVYHEEVIRPKARAEYEKNSILRHLYSMYCFLPKKAQNKVVTDQNKQKAQTE